MGRLTDREVTTKKKAMLEALHATMGNVSQAIKLVGINRKTYYNWRTKDDKFREEADTVTEYVFDFVESEIFKQIKKGNTAMIIFYAKTRMKARGYIERQEFVTGDRPNFVVKENAESVKKVMAVIHKHNDRKQSAG